MTAKSEMRTKYTTIYGKTEVFKSNKIQPFAEHQLVKKARKRRLNVRARLALDKRSRWID